METLYQLLALIGAGLIVWIIFRTVKGRPELFSRASLSKSLSTLGFLALFLIGFVGLLVFMLRQ